MAAELVDVFQQYDVNGDGKIQREELAAVFRELDPVHWTDQRIDSLMNLADQNGDGVLGYEEFLSWLDEGHQDQWSADRQAARLRVADARRSDFNTNILVFDNRSVVRHSGYYTVRLQPRRGVKLGFKVELANQDTLLIGSLADQGLLKTWNHENPDLQVGVGDQIMEVNGPGNAAQLKWELRQDRLLEILLKPRDSAVCFLSKVSDTYEVDSIALAEGGFSTVFKAIHKETRTTYGLKSYHKAKINISEFDSEVSLLKRLDHPHIIRLYAVFEDFRHSHLVTELCSGGELFERILAEQNFSERQAARVMQQMLGAITYLHSNFVCHRDLKPENCLLLDNGTLETCQVKIIDFRTAAEFQSGTLFKTRVAHALFRAPEAIQNRYNHSCDAWSCGAIMYMIIAGYPPFSGDNDRDIEKRLVSDPLRFPVDDWRDVSESAKDLIGRLLEKDPRNRIDVAEGLHHAWIEDVGPKIVDFSLVQCQANMRGFQTNHGLKKAALHAMALQFKHQDMQEVKDMFALLDDNGDGCVTYYELKSGFDRLGRMELADRLRELLEAADVDGNGKLEYTEFLAAAMDQKSYYEEDACFAAFTVFDHNSNGFIDRRELVAVFQESNLGATMDRAAIARVLESADGDQDGEISFPEFMEMIRCEGST